MGSCWAGAALVNNRVDREQVIEMARVFMAGGIAIMVRKAAPGE
jgi:hypothetical protein